MKDTTGYLSPEMKKRAFPERPKESEFNTEFQDSPMWKSTHKEPDGQMNLFGGGEKK